MRRRRGEVDAIATAPINKLAFAQAGLKWKGHTDLLAHLCGIDHVAMMFHSPQLKVVLVDRARAAGRGVGVADAASWSIARSR